MISYVLFWVISWKKNKKQGLTVFSALRQSDTHVGDWIVIPGAGGGLGHLGMDHNTIE